MGMNTDRNLNAANTQYNNMQQAFEQEKKGLMPGKYPGEYQLRLTDMYRENVSVKTFPLIIKN